MKLFLRNSFILGLPLLFWAIIVITVDPFNYFGYSKIISHKTKEANSKQVNSLLYKCIDYINKPNSNMLIGDSRTANLPIEDIKNISNEDYKLFSTNAAKLNEIIELSYLAHEKKELKKLVIGINFNMFNKYGYQDRVSGVKKILKNPLLYIFNKNIAESTYLVLKGALLGTKVNSKPPMTKEEFWKWNIETKATHWYGKYKYPDKLYNELIKFDKFCLKNNIDLTFIIVPHHNEFRSRLVEFGLKDKESNFKEILSKLNATVYDFDFDNIITKDKNNFSDPVHYNHDIGKLMVSEIWKNQLKVGKKL